MILLQVVAKLVHADVQLLLFKLQQLRLLPLRFKLLLSHLLFLLSLPRVKLLTALLYLIPNLAPVFVVDAFHLVKVAHDL